MGRQDRATSGATRAAGLTRTELPCVTRHAVLAPALRALRSLSRSSVNAIAHEAAVCCDKHAQDRHVTIFLHRIASPAASASQVYGSLSTRILACRDSDTVTVARTSHASHASGRVRTVVSASPRVGASAAAAFCHLSEHTSRDIAPTCVHMEALTVSGGLDQYVARPSLSLSHGLETRAKLAPACLTLARTGCEKNAYRCTRNGSVDS